MGNVYPLQDGQEADAVQTAGDRRDDLDQLIRENAQLRELVIQLSKLVIRNAADRR